MVQKIIFYKPTFQGMQRYTIPVFVELNQILVYSIEKTVYLKHYNYLLGDLYL